MAKATISTGQDAQAVHTRTTLDATETQAAVLVIDGADDAVPAHATFGLGVAEVGTYAYASGTSTGTVDVPAGARLRRVSVLAGGGGATVTIGGGATITIPASSAFDEQISGVALGADVVIGGSITTYYVAWVA